MVGTFAMGPLPQEAPMAFRKKPLMPSWSPLAAEASPAARLAATRAVVPQRTLLIAGGSPSSGPTAGPHPGHVLDQGTVQKLKRYFREFPGASSTRPPKRGWRGPPVAALQRCRPCPPTHPAPGLDFHPG